MSSSNNTSGSDPCAKWAKLRVDTTFTGVIIVVVASYLLSFYFVYSLKRSISEQSRRMAGHITLRKTLKIIPLQTWWRIALVSSILLIQTASLAYYVSYALMINSCSYYLPYTYTAWAARSIGVVLSMLFYTLCVLE